MPESLDALIARLDRIEADLEAADRAHRGEIEAVAPEHRAGATNLVHYTALRQQDLRGLQNDLMDLGATSLATAEAKMQAARTVLTALRGDAGPWDLDAIDQALDEGDDILDADARALFGAPRPGRPTRIMVTMPAEAADEPELLAAFVDAGMDVARINCPHDGPAAWERMIAHIRAAAKAAGQSVVVSMDLAGPKLRTGPISDGPAIGRARVTRDATGRLISPSRLWLVSSDRPAAPAPAPALPADRAALTIAVHPAWLSVRRAGDVVCLRDARGRRRLFTVARVAPDGVLAEGDRSAYVAEGTLLDCAGKTTAAGGIPPLPRRLSLAPGDRLLLASDPSAVDPPASGEVARIGCTLPEAVAALRPGQPVSTKAHTSWTRSRHWMTSWPGWVSAAQEPDADAPRPLPGWPVGDGAQKRSDCDGRGERAIPDGREPGGVDEAVGSLASVPGFLRGVSRGGWVFGGEQQPLRPGVPGRAVDRRDRVACGILGGQQRHTVCRIASRLMRVMALVPPTPPSWPGAECGVRSCRPGRRRAGP